MSIRILAFSLNEMESHWEFWVEEKCIRILFRKDHSGCSILESVGKQPLKQGETLHLL